MTVTQHPICTTANYLQQANTGKYSVVSVIQERERERERCEHKQIIFLEVARHGLVLVDAETGV